MNDAMLKQSLKNQKVIMHGLSMILEHIAFGNRSASTLIDVRNKIMAQYSVTGELLHRGDGMNKSCMICKHYCIRFKWCSKWNCYKNDVCRFYAPYSG